MKTRFGWILAAALGLALVSGLAAAAQMYKWVDKDGHVHFSQTPPPSTGVQAQQVNISAPPPDPTSLQNSQNLQQQIAEQNEKAKADPEQEKQKQSAEAQKKAHCDDLRSRLNVLNSSGRTATVDAQGNMNYLSDEDRQKQMQAIEDQISRECGGSDR